MIWGVCDHRLYVREQYEWEGSDCWVGILRRIGGVGLGFVTELRKLGWDFGSKKMERMAW